MTNDLQREYEKELAIRIDQIRNLEASNARLREALEDVLPEAEHRRDVIDDPDVAVEFVVRMDKARAALAHDAAEGEPL